MMNSMQSKLLMYAGLILIVNLLFPPVVESNGGLQMGRNFLGWDAKYTTRTVQAEDGKWVGKQQKRSVEVDLTRLVVSESFILGGALLLFGLLADDKVIRKKLGM